MVDIIVFQEETDPQKFEFDTFEEAAADARLYLVPEIATAIDDAIAEGESGARIRQFTQILCNLCSPDNHIVAEAIKEWQDLAVSERIGTLWVELRE